MQPPILGLWQAERLPCKLAVLMLSNPSRMQNWRMILQDQDCVCPKPMGLQPQARHFPARNRIISGLAQAVVIVEAAAKSGSLITARNALDQGREVLAVPGHPFDAHDRGCNMLIRDGATLVRGASNVLEAIKTTKDRPTPEIGPAAAAPKQSLRVTAALHSEILARLGPSPIAEDQLARDIRANASDIAPVLVDLELDGKILCQAGGLLSRINEFSARFLQIFLPSLTFARQTPHLARLMDV
jgi:DNA processing protein